MCLGRPLLDQPRPSPSPQWGRPQPPPQRVKVPLAGPRVPPDHGRGLRGRHVPRRREVGQGACGAEQLPHRVGGHGLDVAAAHAGGRIPQRRPRGHQRRTAAEHRVAGRGRAGPRNGRARYFPKGLVGWARTGNRPPCSLRSRSSARHPPHARAGRTGAARGPGWLRASLDLRCARRRPGGVGTKGVPTFRRRLRRASNKGQVLGRFSRPKPLAR